MTGCREICLAGSLGFCSCRKPTFGNSNRCRTYRTGQNHHDCWRTSNEVTSSIRFELHAHERHGPKLAHVPENQIQSCETKPCAALCVTGFPALGCSNCLRRLPGQDQTGHSSESCECRQILKWHAGGKIHALLFRALLGKACSLRNPLSERPFGG